MNWADVEESLHQLKGRSKREGNLLEQVYLDLRHVKHWKTIRICELPEQHISYIVGQSEENAQEQIVLPILTSQSVDPHLMHEVITKTTTQGQRRVNLAVLESDSTVAYYSVYDGLQPPKP
ncbi:hypothetical protein PROFUN_09110 [Planoprotostelium fungivorum]|uniref:tRNA-splicing endonuclease subunit Sen15 domain-containing protein n=1 Tax=Planoprotostelium fungivorum TaxID=1890364 RepID=A0A2P6NHZ9_9EUKA|nr:hypothetical protein PROFUN_09110 [Planoprotostelium fungivorum]